MTIYNSLDGPNWTDNDNWNNGGDPCAAATPWYGVICDAPGGNVVWVSLSSNGLDGDIAGVDLSGLVNAWSVDFEDNDIYGNIGDLDLTGLANLEDLRLEGNQFSGDIGGLDLSGVPNLGFLFLSFNQITGDLALLDLSSNSNLAVFWITDNLLDGEVADMTGTSIHDEASSLCGGDNIIRPSGDAAVDTYAENFDNSGWSATYGCPQLATSVSCNADNLEVTIDQGDGPFNVNGTGTGLPMLGIGLRIGEPDLAGPGTWTGVAISETAGDTETIDFGNFTCGTPSGGSKKGSNSSKKAEEEVTVEASVSAPASAQIVLSGSVSQTTMAPGDILTWTFTVENRGDATSDPLSFSATIPDGLTGVTVTTTQGAVITAGPPTTTVDLDRIPPGGMVTITISGTWSGGTAQHGVRVRVMPGHANQEAGDEVCVLGMVADQSLNICVTNFPSTLPSTGGQPVEPVPWGWIAAAGTLLIGAGAWFGIRQRASA